MDFSVTQAWGLLDKIRVNTDSWYPILEEKRGVEPDYDCVKLFFKSSKMKNVSNELHVGTDSALQGLKDFSEFLQVPKQDFFGQTKNNKAIDRNS